MQWQELCAQHGGSSIASLHDSMRGWPYTPETVLEDLSPVNLSAGSCSEGRTDLTFMAPVSGIYRTYVVAAIRKTGRVVNDTAREEPAYLEQVKGSGRLVEVLPSF